LDSATEHNYSIDFNYCSDFLHFFSFFFFSAQHLTLNSFIDIKSINCDATLSVWD